MSTQEPRAIKVHRENGWVEIAVFFRNEQGWQHRAIRVTDREFKEIQSQ